MFRRSFLAGLAALFGVKCVAQEAPIQIGHMVLQPVVIPGFYKDCWPKNLVCPINVYKGNTYREVLDQILFDAGSVYGVYLTSMKANELPIGCIKVFQGPYVHKDKIIVKAAICCCSPEDIDITGKKPFPKFNQTNL